MHHTDSEAPLCSFSGSVYTCIYIHVVTSTVYQYGMHGMIPSPHTEDEALREEVIAVDGVVEEYFAFDNR